ncbi:AAA family ATPase [Bacteroides sp. 519]|uniref:AAA family ATPase n=1 Tax=Bacteroides sp. 519 TaxID=2302937 RepID=UPI0013D6F9CD|nr:AAA family ATPase [Bacteroides sp. 519]NDV57889.1 ATP-binding cassette domain-containing protein [Bacteroides sp. 519]
MAYLNKVEIKSLWGTKNIAWNNIHEDVNIIVGINGSGKTTLLNLIWGAITNDSKIKNKYNHSEATYQYTYSDIPLIAEFITTFDVVYSHKKKSESPLTLDLLDAIYTTGQSKNTFYDYRLKATNFPEQADSINKRIQSFYKLIDKQFSTTNKKIEVDPHTNKLIFKQNGNTIQLEDLSSGEKQFLLIMFKVFLMEEKPYILLMDEPEISMHIEWQFELINTIRELNPNCQIILATHSPGIFGNGWGDKVVYMEDIMSDAN